MSKAAIPLPLIQNTKEWEAARAGSIGSSTIPVLTGNSPYRSTSPFDVWAFITRKATPAPIDPMTQELFDLGHALEPVIADRYTVLSGRKLRRVRRMLQHPEIPWATASLDRVSAVKGERLIVEVKWVPWRRWEEGPEPVPAYVQDQVQWQLLVTGYEAAEVAVLNGSHIDRHTILPDDDYQQGLITIGRDFYENHVVTGIAPPIDGSDATRKALLRMYPSDDGELLAPTAELEALMREWHSTEPEVKAITERLDRVKNAVRSALGDHAGAEFSGHWKVSHRLSKGRTTTDWKAVATAYRALLDTALPGETQAAHLDAIEMDHTTTSEGSRVLRATWPKAAAEGGETWT